MPENSFSPSKIALIKVQIALSTVHAFRMLELCEYEEDWIIDIRLGAAAAGYNNEPNVYERLGDEFSEFRSMLVIEYMNGMTEKELEDDSEVWCSRWDTY